MPPKPKVEEPVVAAEPEVPPEPTTGEGSFYYVDGATYVGGWLLPDPPKPDAPPGSSPGIFPSLALWG